MEESDIIIYQALSKQICSILTDTVIKKTFHTKILVSIPFVKIYGIYPLEYSSGIIFGEEIILNLLRQGIKKERIYTLFEEGSIDFDLDNRFNDSFNKMNSFHPNTTIKLSKFIKNNYKNKKLFNSFSHPTNELYSEICRQLSKILNINNINLNSITEQLGSATSISPNDCKKYNYNLDIYYDGAWYMKGCLIIDLIEARYQMAKSNKDTV